MSSDGPDSEPSLCKVSLTNAERREVDAKGNLFSIIKAVDAVEKAFATGRTLMDHMGGKFATRPHWRR